MKGEVRLIEIKCPKCGYLQTVARPGDSEDTPPASMKK